MRAEAEQGGTLAPFQASGKGWLLTGEGGITLTPSWGTGLEREDPRTSRSSALRGLWLPLPLSLPPSL